MMRAPGKVDLYVRKDVIMRGIPNEEACDALIQLIKDNDRWVDKDEEECDEEDEECVTVSAENEAEAVAASERRASSASRAANTAAKPNSAAATVAAKPNAKMAAALERQFSK